MPSNQADLLPQIIPITIFILVIFYLFISQVLKSSFASQYIRDNTVIIVILGFIMCSFIFMVNTAFISNTSESNPPHGVGLGIWDMDPEQDKFGGTAFLYKNEYFALGSEDSFVAYISRERFQRYLRPPFLRQFCYTANVVGCTWADIDILNYSDDVEWVDYLIQIGIAIFSGLAGSEMIRSRINKTRLIGNSL
jgi:hypothetical protein